MMHIKYRLEDTAPRYQYYYARLYERLACVADRAARKLTRTTADLAILDVGCGRGEVLQRLAREGYRNLVGIDFDENCKELSASFAETHVCSVAELREKFPDRTFDIVICSHVLEHIETPRQLLLELQALNAAALILAVPNLGNPFKHRKRVILENRGHVCGWDSTHLNTLLHTSGWQVTHWESDMVLLPEKLRRRLPAFLRSALEERLLPTLHPFVFSQSLICCAEKAAATLE